MTTLIPSISAKALSAMPQFILNELGAKGLSKVFKAAGLPLRFLEVRDGYIPEQAAANFIVESSKILGHEQIGLLWSPYVFIRDYGAWGRFVLSAPTLGIALSRLLHVLPFHANCDRAGLEINDQTVRLTYQFALRGHEAYSSIAHTTLSALLDIIRHFLGKDWIPDLILIDLPKTVGANYIEETYGCPVLFGSEDLVIAFSIKELKAPNKTPELFPKTTIHDIVRERASGPPNGIVEIVRNMLLIQMVDNEISVENSAKMLDIGVRRLQRTLEREGTSFRKLSNNVIAQRAIELLGLPGEMVSSVAFELGYSSPAAFSRAFKNEIGEPPELFLRK